MQTIKAKFINSKSWLMSKLSKFQTHIVGFGFVSFLLLIYMMLGGWSYPLSQVTKPECRKYTWEEAQNTGNCIMSLPKIESADYSVYKKDTNYRYTYSVLRGGSYSDGWDNPAGSSPGIDVATSRGTPVYSIGDGEVIYADYAKGLGNTITIKHLYKDSYIYSSYSHLDEIGVKKGDKITDGQNIGKVGKTGRTIGQYGNHLDFQITTTKQKFYPYSFGDCEDRGSGGFYNIIEFGQCRAKLLANTADPIYFLQNNGASFHNTSSYANISNYNNINKNTSSSIAGAKTSNKNVVTVSNNTDNYYQKIIDQQEQFQKLSLNISPQNISSKEVAKLNSKYKFNIKITDKKTGKDYNGKLPSAIRVHDTQGLIRFDRKNFVETSSDGNLDVYMTSQKVGSTVLKIFYGTTALGSYSIKIMK